jgi:hypothetical protein
VGRIPRRSAISDDDPLDFVKADLVRGGVVELGGSRRSAYGLQPSADGAACNPEPSPALQRLPPAARSLRRTGPADVAKGCWACSRVPPFSRQAVISGRRVNSGRSAGDAAHSPPTTFNTNGLARSSRDDKRIGTVSLP